MTSILLLRSAHLSALSVVCVCVCLCMCINSKTYAAQWHQNELTIISMPMPGFGRVCAYAGIVCARCVCVCVFGCVVVGRVYYNFPRFFITLNFSTQVSSFSSAGVAAAVAAFVFHLRFVASFYNSPILSLFVSGAPVKCHCALLLLLLCMREKQQMRRLTLTALLRLCRVATIIKNVARLVQQQQQQHGQVPIRIYYCALFLFLLHTRTDALRTHTHRQRVSVCALSHSVSLSPSLSLARAL